MRSIIHDRTGRRIPIAASDCQKELEAIQKRHEALTEIVDQLKAELEKKKDSKKTKKTKERKLTGPERLGSLGIGGRQPDGTYPGETKEID